jgi:predicted dehydrogenase
MIGVIGAGVIAGAAHFPAYAKLNLPVAAVFDVNRGRAESLAGRWHTRCASDLENLLSDPQVEIVDIAVPPAAQVTIIETVLRAGKHVLAQKPLAPTLSEAKRLVDLADASGRCLVVNQQMRWSPVVNVIRNGIERQTLGVLQSLIFYIDLPVPPGRQPGWLAREPRLIALFNTIHFLDTARFLLGEPCSVVASIRQQDQHLDIAGETGLTAVLTFQGGAEVLIVDQRNAYGDHLAFFRAGGSNGALRGRFGLWTNYPTGADDEIEYASVGAPDGWKPVRTEGRWIPDAFVGPISELVEAIRGGPEPSTSGHDHLRTLALVEAIYTSAGSGRKVNFADK